LLLTITNNGTEPHDEVPVTQLDVLQALPCLARLQLNHVYTPHLLPLSYATRAGLKQVVLYFRLIAASQHREDYIGLDDIVACIGEQLRLEAVARWKFYVDDQREAEGQEAPWRDEVWQDWVHDRKEKGEQVLVKPNDNVNETGGIHWHWRVA
jgi:hypothetical protein